MPKNQSGDQPSQRYTTHEIAALCHVTRKQLRYYEEAGLLRGVTREGNNYRSYTPEQIYQLVGAKCLREADLPAREIASMLYAEDFPALQQLLTGQITRAKSRLERALKQYEQILSLHTELVSAALAREREAHAPARYPVLQVPSRQVVALSYRSTWQDDQYMDVYNLARILSVAERVHTLQFGALLYLTSGHFDSRSCTFSQEIHDYEIAIPVLDEEVPCSCYRTLPAFTGLSALHIGDPKNESLSSTYLGLLHYAREQGIELMARSVEEWLASPMMTSRKELWTIRIIIPIRSRRNGPPAEKPAPAAGS